MSVDLSNVSIANWFEDEERHRCGYCRNAVGSVSYGMMSEQITVEDYKDLIDRGWRRSGKYCYKPTMNKTCCPQYTIRCNAVEFSLNKSHKKIIKKFNKYLNDGIYNQHISNEQGGDACSEIFGLNKESAVDISQLANIDCVKSDEVKSQLNSNIGNNAGEPHGHASRNVSVPVDNSQKVMKDKGERKAKGKKPVSTGCGADPNKPPCKKAKVLRLERKNEKMLKKDIEFKPPKIDNQQKSLNDYLKDISATSKHKLKLVLISPSNDDQWKKIKDIEYELYKKYQTVVHNDPPEKLSINSFSRFLVISPLKIILITMTENHPTFQLSADLFQRYQLFVHNDINCDEQQYYQFLVNTPLKPKPFPGGIEGPGYGSFHQQYWLDDKLIAVGVIDILPGCVSSVYFFYDPDYRNLTLGTYGSLRELQLVQDLYTRIPDLKYYYMGFYIHSCPKMRYKGKLKPSFLLCPETYTWHPIENCLPKLDVNKYSRLNDNLDAIDHNTCNVDDINNIQLIYNYKLLNVQTFVRLYGEHEGLFENIALLVGKKCAHKIIFWLT